MPDLVILKDIENAFTQGGNRLCFFHPDDDNLCIKIPRPDRTPELRRQQKSFPKNLKPLSHFDENKCELMELQRIEKNIGDKAFLLTPRCFGMVNTDLGEGLCLEMIKDHDGKVSLSLKQYLWINGITTSLETALAFFAEQWQHLGMPSRDLLLHNIVVQQDVAGVKRLVVIDGLGWSGFSFLYTGCKRLARHRAAKKITKLKQAMTQLAVKKENNVDWGYHGWLNEEQRLSK